MHSTGIRALLDPLRGCRLRRRGGITRRLAMRFMQPVAHCALGRGGEGGGSFRPADYLILSLHSIAGASTGVQFMLKTCRSMLNVYIKLSLLTQPMKAGTPPDSR